MKRKSNNSGRQVRSQEEIEARLKAWKRPEPKFKKGWLGLYCKIAASGSEGAILKYDNL